MAFNNAPFITDCISCAIGQDYWNIEIIVVDQNSSDGTVDIIRARFPDVTLIRNTSNTGYAAGMNRGIAAAAGDYVLLLNSDLFLEPTFIRRAIAQLQAYAPEARVGMLASIAYRFKAGERTCEIESVGTMLAPYHTAVDNERIDQVEWVAGPNSAASVLSRALLDDIRLPSEEYFDQRYFCYGEDVELAMRAQLLAWRCVFAPIPNGWHIGGASANGGARYSDKPPDLLVHALKNRHLTLLACYPMGLLLSALPWHLVVEAGQVAVSLFRRRWWMLECQLRAYAAVLRLLPYVLAKRRWLQSRRRVSSSYLRTLYVKWGVIRTFASLVRKI